VKKKTGGGVPAPVRLRVANPRQGDFAKPDKKKRRRASGIPPILLTGEQADCSKLQRAACLVMLRDAHAFFARPDIGPLTRVCSADRRHDAPD
jgi:hypothetical protein